MAIEPWNPALLRTETFASMGGVRVSFDPEWIAVSDGDLVGFNATRPSTKLWRTDVVVGLVSRTAAGADASSVESFLSNARSAPGALVEETGTTIELFGRQLDGYSFGGTMRGRQNPLFTVNRVGVNTVGGAWTPFPRAELYIGETPNGVLVAGAIGSDDDDLDRTTAMFEQLVPYIEFAGVLDEAPTDLAVLGVDDGGDRPTPGDPISDIPVLDALYSPVAPRTWQIVNMGEPFAIDIDGEWWVQPNFAGFLALTTPDSFGPGNSGVEMLLGVEQGRPSTAALAPAGEIVDMSDIRAFAENPPASLVVDGLVDVDVGGRAGVRFDVRFRDDLDCSVREPCVYAVWTRFGLTKQWRSGFEHRVWWIEEYPGGPLMISASTTEANFLAEADQLVESISFSDS